MSFHTKDSIRATADCCGFSGTLAAIELHSCNIQEFGGRCEDYPCCGHTDGDGCQTTPEMTSDFYYRNPEFLHEPGSPEWYDAMDDKYDDQEDEDYEEDVVKPDFTYSIDDPTYFSRRGE